MNNKIILTLAISIDGFIADIDGGYDWLQPSGESQLNTEVKWSHSKFLKDVSAVIMGKRCYDQDMHLDYKNKEVYVATTKELHDYDNVHFIGKDICKEVRRIKENQVGNVYLFGGGKLIDPLLKSGLVDEYIIGIIPIILGEGIPLFLDNNPTIPLHLVDYFIEDGIINLHYIPRINTSFE